MGSYRNARIGTDACASNDHNLACFEKRVGDPLQKNILCRGDLGGRHTEGVLELAHWTFRSGVPTIRHCYYDADGRGASDNNATRAPDFVNIYLAQEIE